MQRTMMPATERDREIIADLAPKRTRLRECEVVGVRGPAAAQQAGLLRDVAQMLPVAIAPGRRDCEGALVNTVSLAGIGAFGGGIHLGRGNLGYRRLIVRDCGGLGSWELRQPLFEGVLHE